MNQSSQKQQQPTFRSAINMLYFLASSHATCLTPFLHHSFGSEAFGLNALGALFLMLVYEGETRCLAMGDFIAAWLVAVVIQRVRTFVVWRRGWRLHSRYGGYPWLTMRIPFIKSETDALALEAFVCLFGGALLCNWSEPVGQFVMAGVFSLTIKNGMERHIDRRRVQQMHDAMIEQAHLVESFQQHRKDY